MNRFSLLKALVLLIAALVALPLAGVLLAAVQGVFSAASAENLLHQARTVLPGYVLTTLALCALVCFGAACLGLGAALLVSVFEFPSRRVAEWALMLPAAAPAYVLAYAYTDFFQTSGPLGSILGLTRGFDIRNLWGAAFVLSAALYPYVYLLARAALVDMSASLWEAACGLGLSTRQAMQRVLVPLVRPAVAAASALVLMETIADYGVSSYFGIGTLTTGVYRAWLNMNDWLAAAQLAVVSLAFVLLAVKLERHSRKRMSVARGGHSRRMTRMPLSGTRAAFAVVLAWLPVSLGFFLPLALLIRHMLQAETLSFAPYAGVVWSTLKLGAFGATAAFCVAALIAVALRLRGGRALHVASHAVSLGYGVPGAVIAVGVLAPVIFLREQGLTQIGALFTATIFAVVYAYTVRFAAVALGPINAAYEALSPRVDESAQSLGAGSARLVFGVHLPILKVPLASAWLIVMLDVMKELPATTLLRPFGYDTLATTAHQLARDERLSEAAIPALAIVALGLIPVILVVRRFR